MPMTAANVVSSCQRRSGHSRLGQRVKTPRLTVGVSQNGQRSGGRGGQQRVGAPELLGQRTARHVPDALDPDREQHDAERPRAAGLDRRQQAVHAHLAEAVELQ